MSEARGARSPQLLRQASLTDNSWKRQVASAGRLAAAVPQAPDGTYQLPTAATGRHAFRLGSVDLEGDLDLAESSVTGVASRVVAKAAVRAKAAVAWVSGAGGGGGGSSGSGGGGGGGSGGGGDGGGGSGGASQASGTVTHFLLYLNKDTFVGAMGEQLIKELRVARNKVSVVSIAARRPRSPNAILATAVLAKAIPATAIPATALLTMSRQRSSSCMNAVATVWRCAASVASLASTPSCPKTSRGRPAAYHPSPLAPTLHPLPHRYLSLSHHLCPHAHPRSLAPFTSTLTPPPPHPSTVPCTSTSSLSLTLHPPPSTSQGGLFSTVATPLHDSPRHRAVSLGLLAIGLGATPLRHAPTHHAPTHAKPRGASLSRQSSDISASSRQSELDPDCDTHTVTVEVEGGGGGGGADGGADGGGADGGRGGGGEAAEAAAPRRESLFGGGGGGLRGLQITGSEEAPPHAVGLEGFLPSSPTRLRRISAAARHMKSKRPAEHDMITAVRDELAALSNTTAAGVRLPRAGVGFDSGDVGPWVACPLPLGALRVSLLPFLAGGTYAILTATDAVTARGAAGGGGGVAVGGGGVAVGSEGGAPQSRPMSLERGGTSLWKEEVSGESTSHVVLDLEASPTRTPTPTLPLPPPLPLPLPQPQPLPLPLTPTLNQASHASRYVGMLSPLHALTLSADKRAQAQIPVIAMYYCFVYPLRDSDHGALADEATISPQALDLARYGGYAYFNDGHVSDTSVNAWEAKARTRAATDSWEEMLPQVIPAMEVDGWSGRKMQNAMSTTQQGGIELCGVNALRDAAHGEGGFFFSGPIRLGVHRAQVRREVLIPPLSTRRSHALPPEALTHTRPYTP